jgi:hypothetical protein
MKIKIGLKEFDLTKVSIYISDLYVEMVRLMADSQTIEADFETLRLQNRIDYEQAETKIERLKAELALLRGTNDLRKEKIGKSVEAAAKRDEVIKEIVLLNGYEYDEELWKKNISEEMFEDIAGELIGRKKKATQDST